MVEQLVLWEKNLFLLLNSPHTPWLDAVMYAISDKYPWTLYSVGFLFLLFYKEKWRECLLLIGTIILLILIGDQLSSHIFKPFFQRYRPTHHPETRDLVLTVLDYRGGSYGFISGHTTNFFSFGTFTALLLRHRIYTIAAYLTVTTVAYSRIYLGVHFVTDVIPGVFVGLLIGWGVYRLYLVAREVFLRVPATEVREPYLRHPQKRSIAAGFLSVFYILVWLLSPIAFPLYQ